MWDNILFAGTLVASAAVIITKWFDCTTTLGHITGISMEANPIARALMHRLGIKGTVWLAFVLTILVTVISQWWVQFQTTHPLWDIAYILTASFTALVQGATAHSNATGKRNLVVMMLFKLIQKSTL